MSPWLLCKFKILIRSLLSENFWLQTIVAFTIDELGLFLSWNMKVDLPQGTFSEGTLLFLESGYGDSPLSITLYGISSWRLNTGFEPIEGIHSWFNQDKCRSPCNCFSHTLPFFCPFLIVKAGLGQIVPLWEDVWVGETCDVLFEHFDLIGSFPYVFLASMASSHSVLIGSFPMYFLLLWHLPTWLQFHWNSIVQ